jgi:hypothetical protein
MEIVNTRAALPDLAAPVVIFKLDVKGLVEIANPMA